MFKNPIFKRLDIQKKFKQTIAWLLQNFPIIVGILLLVSILKNSWVFNFLFDLNDSFLNVLISSWIWGLAAWNPINSYIIAWEIWDFESKIILISGFLISWVTVWFLQIPWEIYFLWKKFSILRNILSFIFSIIWWYLIFYFYNLF